MYTSRRELLLGYTGKSVGVFKAAAHLEARVRLTFRLHPFGSHGCYSGTVRADCTRHGRTHQPFLSTVKRWPGQNATRRYWAGKWLGYCGTPDPPYITAVHH